MTTRRDYQPKFRKLAFLLNVDVEFLHEVISDCYTGDQDVISVSVRRPKPEPPSIIDRMAQELFMNPDDIKFAILRAYPSAPGKLSTVRVRRFKKEK